MPDGTIKELAQKFGEKNASFIRWIMENHFTRGEFESSQGKITKYHFSDVKSKEEVK